MERSSNPF